MGKSGVLAVTFFMVLIAAAAGLDDSPPPLRRSTTIAVTGGLRDARDASRLYNESCERCRAGDLDEAARLLLAAIRAGFDDWSHLCRDADMRPLHDHKVYQAIMAARDAADPLLVQRRLDAWRSSHDAAAYRFETDPNRLLTFASSLDEGEQSLMRGEVEALWDELSWSLFSPQRHRVLIILPAAADAADLLPDAHAHGHYSHRARQLVAREPGRALRHELVHALHHGHMDALGQEHPAWIQEGLACLFEAWTLDADGEVEFPANDRDDAVRILAAKAALLDWATLMDMSADDLAREAPRAYPQLRSMMRFIASDHAGVTGWYTAYVSGFETDPAGVRALESVLGRPLADLEREWRRWLH